MPVLSKSVEIQASPRTVWSLLSTREGLREWFEPSLEIDVQVGGFHRHVDERTQSPISGYVLEMVPEQSLVLSWLEADGDWKFPVRLSFTLAEIPGGTQVTMAFDGFPGIGKPTWDRTQRAYERGIAEHETLESLKRAAESVRAS